MRRDHEDSNSEGGGWQVDGGLSVPKAQHLHVMRRFSLLYIMSDESTNVLLCSW